MPDSLPCVRAVPCTYGYSLKSDYSQFLEKMSYQYQAQEIIGNCYAPSVHGGNVNGWLHTGMKTDLTKVPPESNGSL